MKTFEEFLVGKCPCHTNNSEEGFEKWLDNLDVSEVMEYAEDYGQECESFGFERAAKIALDTLKYKPQ